MKYNHITKVRSRQRVKPAAVQPIVMWTPTLGRFVYKNMTRKVLIYKLLSFVFGIVIFLILSKIQFKTDNPLINYLFSFRYLIMALYLIQRNIISLIFFVIPIITVFLEILCVKSNKKSISILSCIFLCLFNLNQYLVFINIMYI